MSEILQPCPFCGGKAITATFLDYDDLDYMAFEVNDSESIDGEVTCENERCISGWYLSPKDWNTRPIEDALNKRIAELSQAIGLVTTLKPTMVMDVDHPLDMAKEVVEHVTAHIAELEEKQRWIPVSERLPEDCERVWVRATNSPHNLPRRAFHTYRNGKWVNDEVDIDNVYSNLNVTHWMPMPQLPEVQE